MVTAGLLLSCVGLMGLAFGLAPELLLDFFRLLLPGGMLDLASPAQQPIVAVSGAVYLSGIVLVAGGLLRRAALSNLATLNQQKADLEALQLAVLRSLERLETRYGEAIEQRQLASHRMRDLANQFEKAAAGAGPG